MNPVNPKPLSTPVTPRLSTLLTARPPLRFDPVKTGWLALMVGGAVCLGPRLATPGLLAVSFALTVLTVCLGHSVGLHRGIIHRTYECSRTVRDVLLYLFVLTGLGPPLGWIRLHAIRDAAQNDPRSSDVFGYEHGLLEDFVLNLLMSFDLDERTNDLAVPEALRRDPYLILLSRTWLLHQGLLALLLGAVGGWSYVVSGVCVRVSLTILGHWFVGYVAHTHGRLAFQIDGVREEGRNVPVLGLISFGEGWHNNHHAWPDSARFGMFPGEIDLGFLALGVMEKLALVHAVKTPENIAPRPGVHPVAAVALSRSAR